MLAIRMQRLGRKGHPTYRVVVQDVRQTPTSGKYVALLGSYDPHTKSTTLVKEKAEFYLKNGAQPSDRVVRLFSAEGIALPTWVKQPTDRTRSIRNNDKLRRNRPAEEAPEEAPAEVTEEAVEETPTEEAPVVEPTADESAETSTEENAETEAPEESSKEEPEAESEEKS